MTIFCHFGCIIPNIHVTLDHFPVTLDISCHFGQCHKRLYFLLVSRGSERLRDGAQSRRSTRLHKGAQSRGSTRLHNTVQFGGNGSHCMKASTLHRSGHFVRVLMGVWGEPS